MKKKIFIIILVLIILILGVSFGIAEYIKQRDNKIALIQDNVIIEYGKTYNPGLEELIDLQKFNYIDVDKVKIESNIVNEENKEYPKVGEYEIKIHYKNRMLKQKVEVKDTIIPELTIQDVIEIEYGTDLTTFDFNKYVTKSDLSELKEYNIDLSNVNSNASGEYETFISIEDVHGNKTEQKFKIKVLEKVEEKAEEPEEKVQNKVVVENKTNDSSKNKVSNSKTTTNTTNEETKNDATKPEEKQQEEMQNQTTNDNTNQDVIVDIVQDASKCTHGQDNYFDTREEAVEQYKNKVKEYSEKVKSKEITYEEYIKVCPYGYEDWSCPYCGKWTISMYYRK